MRRVKRWNVVMASTYCTPVIVRPMAAAAQVPASTPCSVTGAPVMAEMASRSGRGPHREGVDEGGGELGASGLVVPDLGMALADVVAE